MMPAPPFKSLLLLADGAESAVKAAEYAIRLAQTASARLTAISVVDTETLRKLMSVRILVAQEVTEFESELERSQGRHLEAVADLARKANVPIETVLRKGICHSAVLAEQKERQADLLIVGGFRTTFTKHDLVARERQLIVDESPCPVLVVK